MWSPAPLISKDCQGTPRATLHRSECYKDEALTRPNGLLGAHLYKPHESVVGSKEKAKGSVREETFPENENHLVTLEKFAEGQGGGDKG